MTDLVGVEFVANVAPYHSGERAGFSKKDAHRLVVVRRVAVYTSAVGAAALVEPDVPGVPETSDEVKAVTPDLSGLSVRALMEAIAGIHDPAILREAKRGEFRKSAIRAIETRLRALEEEEGEEEE